MPHPRLKLFVFGASAQRDALIIEATAARRGDVTGQFDVEIRDLRDRALQVEERILPTSYLAQAAKIQLRPLLQLLGSPQYGVIGAQFIEARTEIEYRAQELPPDASIELLEAERDQVISRLNSVLASMTSAFYILDSKWRFTYVSEEAERLLRRPRETLIGAIIWDLFPEAVLSTLNTEYRRALRERKLRRFDFYYPPFQTWYEVSACPSPEGLAVSFNDISARRLAEAQLRLLETCIERLNDIVIITEATPIDEPGPRIVFVNEAFEKRLGYSRAEAIGRSPRFLQGPGTSREARARIRSAHEQLVPVREELLNYTRDGREVWLELDIVPVAEETGATSYLVAIERDITDRKGAEAELHKLSRAVEQSSESIVITNADAQIEYVNEAFERVSGYTRDEVMGKNPRMLSSGGAGPGTYQDMWSTLAAGRAWTGEFHNRRKDGTYYDEAAVISPIRQPDGRITHYVAVKEDVTEKRRISTELEKYRHRLEELVSERTSQLAEAREQAEAANSAKSMFLANMSHEIRTPMNGVLGMLEVLASTRLTEQQADIVRTIQESGTTLLGIIDDVLDFSKIEAGRIDIAVAPVSVSDVVEGVCDSLVTVAARRDVDLSVFVEPEIPEHVMTDALRLRQVLYNLVGNAIKFSAGRSHLRGRVLVRAHVVSPSPLRLAFIVADNGIGITPESLEHLFTPFTQAEASTTRRYGGAGLGLSIAKRLVALMHGKINVASAVGDGSIFTVELPFEVPAEQPTRVLPNVEGVHCLLHGHSGVDAATLATYLEYSGAKVHRVESISAALDVVQVVSGPVVALQIAAPTGVRRLEIPGIPLVLITRGKRRRPRRNDAGVVTVDGLALKRETLLRAVSEAAGRTVGDAGSAAMRRLQSFVPAASTTEPAEDDLILVVEDDEINQKVILKQLEILGYRAALARNGTEALALWRKARFALILTDLHMPGMDGYQLAAAIRREESSRTGQTGTSAHTPVVALTANALRGEAEAAKSAGMVEYLTKPVPLSMLRDTLSRLCVR